MEEEKYYIQDIESGVHYEVTKKHYEWYLYNVMLVFSFKKMDEAFRSIAYGTMSDLEGGNNFSDMFFTPPENYKIIKQHWSNNPLIRHFMPINQETGKPEFIFTPGQIQEAKTWIRENCPAIMKKFEDSNSDLIWELWEDELTDMYFQLKGLNFSLQPNEFIVGIEYKDHDKVIIGEEHINIRIQNPSRTVKGEPPHDQFAFSVLNHILTSTQK